jgi:hypothetical protein
MQVVPILADSHARYRPAALDASYLDTQFLEAKANP